MAVIGINTSSVGLVGVKPSIVYIETNDVAATVIQTGYLNKIVAEGNPLSKYNYALVYTTDAGAAFYQIDVTSGNTSLTPAPDVFSEISLASGTAAAPSFNFTADTNTGIYRSGTHTLDIATNGLRQVSVGNVSSGVNYLQLVGSAATNPVQINALGTDTHIGVEITPKGTGSLQNAVGAVATPSYSFVGRLTNGMFSSAANTIDFSTNALECLQLVAAPTSSVNYTTITPSATTNPVIIGAAGSDTNISIKLAPKGTGSVIVPQGNFVQIASGSISAANLLLMYGTPQLCIAAPSAGYGIIVLSAYLEYVFATAANASGGVILFQYGNSIHGAGTNVITNGSLANYAATFITSASANQFAYLINLNNPATAAAGVTATGVYLSNQTGAFTANGGTGSLNYALQYVVVPMA